MKPSKMALICCHCEKRGRPILLVAFTADDGIYQFLCGEDGHDVDDADPIHQSHVVVDDPTIAPLLLIDKTFEAERDSVTSPWRINFSPELD